MMQRKDRAERNARTQRMKGDWETAIAAAHQKEAAMNARLQEALRFCRHASRIS